jgi:hypothetical protein
LLPISQLLVAMQSKKANAALVIPGRAEMREAPERRYPLDTRLSTSF